MICPETDDGSILELLDGGFLSAGGFLVHCLKHWEGITRE